MHIYLATGLTEVGQKLEGDEDLTSSAIRLKSFTK
jgi:hypothetical protein